MRNPSLANPFACNRLLDRVVRRGTLRGRYRAGFRYASTSDAEDAQLELSTTGVATVDVLPRKDGVELFVEFPPRLIEFVAYITLLTCGVLEESTGEPKAHADPLVLDGAYVAPTSPSERAAAIEKLRQELATMYPRVSYRFTEEGRRVLDLSGYQVSADDVPDRALAEFDILDRFHELTYRLLSLLKPASGEGGDRG
jgi:hypothetical protein